MEAIHFIQDLAIILATAGVAGWLCHRIGLSAVVGFLAAGVIVGPYTPPFSLVTDIPRIETMAQLGLIFLMFSIGMNLSLSKLRRMGPGLFLAVTVSAGLVFALTRVAGASIGLGGKETLFLAAMLMVSSSAIISKVLVDVKATHERSGQAAMAVSVLEDVVAVVMLTILNSLTQFGGDAGAGKVNVGETLGLLLAFVVLAGVAGLLVVPWLLRRMSVTANEELQTLGLAGLLFGLALIAQKAGYSIALGAFLLGTIVAETPHRAQVERLFEGMRDIFSAVFFVAIGMQIDPGAMWQVAVPIVLVTLFTLFARTMACSVGLTLVGTPVKDALRTGLMVTPLGEFTFIIAQLGIAGKVLTPKYYPLAVGVSLLTALTAPLLARRSEGISERLLRRQPRWMKDFIEAWHGWLDRLAALKKRNLVWQLSRKRLIQVGVGVLFVTGLFVFGERFSDEVIDWLAGMGLGENGPEMIFWTVLVLLALAPLVAIWRNLSAMAVLYAEIGARGAVNEARLRFIIENGLRMVSGAAMNVWLLTILPVEGMAKWMLLSLSVIALLVLVFLHRRLIYWHSEMELELQAMLAPGRPGVPGGTDNLIGSHGEWNLAIVDCILPDLAACSGRSLRELEIRSKLGATVVGIERSGHLISLPQPDCALFPRDKVLLLGSPEQVNQASAFLQRVESLRAEESDTPLEDVRMERFVVLPGHAVVGASLADVAPAGRFHIQVAGILRNGQRHLNPPASECLQAGDELLCLGTSSCLKAFRLWLR